MGFFFSVRDFSLQFFPTSSFTVRQDHTAKEKGGGQKIESLLVRRVNGYNCNPSRQFSVIPGEKVEREQ